MCSSDLSTPVESYCRSCNQLINFDSVTARKSGRTDKATTKKKMDSPKTANPLWVMAKNPWTTSVANIRSPRFNRARNCFKGKCSKALKGENFKASATMHGYLDIEPSP